jgi:hypothetical protein
VKQYPAYLAAQDVIRAAEEQRDRPRNANTPRTKRGPIYGQWVLAQPEIRLPGILGYTYVKPDSPKFELIMARNKQASKNNEAIHARFAAFRQAGEQLAAAGEI